jgi:poly-beta-1,6-N-acetyl-D-glucosamine synthase
VTPYDFWISLLTASVIGLLYPVALYPCFLLFVTARPFRSRQRERGGPRAAIDGFTVIIPAHNEERVIEKKMTTTLAAVRATRHPAQVIVAADGCTDRTHEIVSRFPGVELVIVQERGGIVGALKAGMQSARYDIVVFSDADIEVDVDNYEALIGRFADPAVGGVCGATRMRVQAGSGLGLERLNVLYRTWIRSRQSDHHSAVGADGANWALRKQLIRWPTRSQLAEDLVVPLEVVRQGYRFVLEPRAGAVETSPTSVRDEYHRKVRTIAGGIQAGWYCKWMFRSQYWWIGFHYLSWKFCKYLVAFWTLLATIAVLNLAPHSRLFAGVSAVLLGAISIGFAGGVARRFVPNAVPCLAESLWYGLVALTTPVAAILMLLTNRATLLWRIAAR